MGTRRDGTNTGKIKSKYGREGMIKKESDEDKKFREGKVYVTFDIPKELKRTTIELDDILVADVMLDDEILITNMILCKGRDIERSVRDKTGKKFLHIHVKVKLFNGKANL